MKRLMLTALTLSIINLSSIALATPTQKSQYSGLYAGIYGGLSTSDYNFKTSTQGLTAGGQSGSSNPLVGARVGLLAPLASPIIRIGGEVFADYTNNTNKFNVTGENTLNIKAENGFTSGFDGIFGLNFSNIGFLYAKMGATVSRLKFNMASSDSSDSLTATGYQNGFLYGFGIERMIQPNLSLNLGYEHIQTTKLTKNSYVDSIQTKQTLGLIRSDVLLSLNYYF